MKALFFLFAMTTFILASCGKFSDGSSVWQEVWIIPVVLFLGAAYSFYRAGKAYKSGSWYWGNDPKVQGGKIRIESDDPPKLTTIGAFWFGVICTAAFIAVIIIQNAEK